MSIKDLVEKYDMKPHEENGRYHECHYLYDGEGRAPSGSSYFYLPPGEMTLFHRIDCDEYWCYNSGESLEVWSIDISGNLKIKKLGVDRDAEPVLFFPKGTVFGSRSINADGEGTFFTCITVPRFSYDGFEIVEKEDVLKICPEAEGFFMA